MEKFLITKEGYEKLKTELDDLKNNQRPQIIDQIAEAREHGDLKENAEYHSAREKQSFIEARIAELDDKFQRAESIDVKSLSGDKVLFGATVSLEDQDSGNVVKYKIVSDFEADIENGFISSGSPVAKSLIGKFLNDDVEVRTPRGEIDYTILKVEFI